MNKIVVLFVIAVVGSASIQAQDKPLVYNRTSKETEQIDRQVDLALAAKYHVIDLPEDSDYTPPRIVTGSLPTEALTKDGQSLDGYVLVAYIITADGHTSSPMVLKSTNEQINEIALNAVNGWSFTPAKYKGQLVSTTAAQEFTFKAPAKGFEVAHVVLYQPNDVLVARMPSVQDLGQYIIELEKILTAHFRDAKTPEAIDVVIGLRPGNLVKVWFISSIRDGNAKEFSELRQQLEAVKPVAVKGQVAFAISGGISGGGVKVSKDDQAFRPPIPKEWKDALKDNTTNKPVPDVYMDVVWPQE